MNFAGLIETRSRALLASMLLTSAASGLSAAALVAIINTALSASPAQLAGLGVPFALVSLAMLALRWVSQSQCARFSQAALAGLRARVSRKLAATPLRELEVRGAAPLLAVLVEDIATFSEFFVTLPRLAMQAVIVLCCLTYLAILSWQAFLFAIAVMLLGSLCHSAAARRAFAHLRQARASEDDLYRHFRALFAGSKELRLNVARRFAFLSDVLGGSVEAVRAQRTRGLSIYVAAGSFGAFLFFAVIGAVIFGLGSVSDVDSGMRSGYALVFLYLMHPLEGLLEGIPELSRAQIAADRIGGVLSANPAPTSSLPLEVPLRSLSLRQVTHTYRSKGEDTGFVLGPVSLELRPGELVFLVGGNGSGKTTIAKLLVGLYEPDDGAVLYNGVPVDARSREAFRNQFSAVFWDFHLFPSLLGAPRPGRDERARALLKKFDLDRRVSVQDGVFSTTRLSRGQQKRLALLAAWMEDRPILVLDEWAADQDPVYRDVFYREFLPELRANGKAILVISHDDRYFHVADRCLKLDNGNLTVVEHTAGDAEWRSPRAPSPPAALPQSAD